MKVSEPDLIIKPVAPLVATSENSIFVDLNVGVYANVIADNWIALDMHFLFDK